MFSFHKPKIYRSNLGCCICKAKSSSSRFTDSKKYENEFERCFRIQEERSGEICNACVLLVKRWKKLSPENRLTKHWHHVVDARAGPGTKLTGNRRITSNHHARADQETGHRASASNKQRTSGGKSDVLPLTSSQANNQTSASGSSSGSSRTRTSSFSKARAIDTNVSTFTFGEPPSAYRKNYMSSEPAGTQGYSSSPSHSSSAFGKPKSALSSSAFESVMKRFRQRQQQQRLEAQRRQLRRQQRLQAHQQVSQKYDNQERQDDSSTQNTDGSSTASSTALPTLLTSTHNSESGLMTKSKQLNTLPTALSRRARRSSENHSANNLSTSSDTCSLEALKICSVLDASIWRRERVCCGFIFRGLNNEVAIFPKLFKPCECKLKQFGLPATGDDEVEEKLSAEEDDEAFESGEKISDDTSHRRPLLNTTTRAPKSPSARATKSGSISSCDSSTSGTGSMEPMLDELKRAGGGKRHKVGERQAQVQRPKSVPGKRRRALKPYDDGTSSKESAESPGGSSSSNSSSQIMMMDGDEDDGEEEDEDDDVDDEADDDDDEDDSAELVLDECESSNDAVSSESAESIMELDGKKGAMAMS